MAEVVENGHGHNVTIRGRFGVDVTVQGVPMRELRELLEELGEYLEGAEDGA